LFIAESTSAIFKKPANALMYTTERILKVRKFKFTEDTMEPTKDGRSCI